MTTDQHTNCPHDYIVIEGVIGVGKTSLSKRISERLNGRLILESFETNPFIRDFYKSPQSYAFKTQLYYLISRFKQSLDMPLPDLFNTPLIVDYLFQKDRLFASVNLDDNELELYNLIWSILEPKVRVPDIVVYLQATTDRLMSRITKRGRDFERTISREYLEALNTAYDDFFFHYTLAPVFIVNTDEIDFVENEADFEDLLSMILTPRAGITFYNPRGR